MQKPKKWTEVYPQGTKEGDEESKFFKCLARHPQWQYRSTAHLAAETGLSRKRVEEIISKYTDANKYNPPLIYAHPTQEDQWGYWERVPEHLEEDKRTITKKDQDRRVKKHIQGLDYIDLNDLPDDYGADGACELQEIPKRKPPMGIGTIGNPNISFTHKKTGVRPSKPRKKIGCKPTCFPPKASCEKRWERIEILTQSGHIIEMDDAPEKKPDYPEIYGFKTPQKHYITMTDGDYKSDEWKDVKGAYSVQDASPEVFPSWNCESYNVTDLDDRWETVEDVTYTITDNPSDLAFTVTVSDGNGGQIPKEGYHVAYSENVSLPIPEMPDFPDITIPDIDLPPVSIELPPLIMGCIDITKNDSGWTLDV